jgi:hypothetical protein
VGAIVRLRHGAPQLIPIALARIGAALLISRARPYADSCFVTSTRGQLSRVARSAGFDVGTKQRNQTGGEAMPHHANDHPHDPAQMILGGIVAKPSSSIRACEEGQT